jgi:hypothetical protein
MLFRMPKRRHAGSSCGVEAGITPVENQPLERAQLHRTAMGGCGETSKDELPTCVRVA